MLIAHSQNAAGEWHRLDDHLNQVATLAAEFSSAWGDPCWARPAGALHARAEFAKRLDVRSANLLAQTVSTSCWRRHRPPSPAGVD
jgi:hypothetical protein